VKTGAVAVVLLGLAACGGSPPSAQPPVAHVAPATGTPPEAAPLLVEFIVIHRRWVEKVLATTPAEVKAWAEAPENASAVSGPFRHILIKAKDSKDEAPARKKAQGILDRIKKGEDFAKLAKQYSEDPGSKESGGEYAADTVKDFVEPVRTAFGSLKPGETTPDLVKTQFGFHIIKKERASDEQIERAYRKARAPEAAKKLGEELLARLKGNAPARPAIAEAVEATLGERATNDAERPSASIIDRERLKQVRLTAAAKAAIETFANSAHPGDLLPSPAIDGDTVLVARALQPGARP
jgi:hypothetical protein